MTQPFVVPLDVELRPDPMRTVIKPFIPDDPPPFADEHHPRGERIVRRLMTLDADGRHAELERVKLSLDERHRDVAELLDRRFEEVAKIVPDLDGCDHDVRQLIGAYFSAEYSFESAALFNPSAVRHPDQSGVAGGDLRFIISLRGIGEGHLSSVAFRTGVWKADGSVALDKASDVAVPPIVEQPDNPPDEETFQLNCRGSREPSETVLFPIVPSQSRGLEDLRLTPFLRDNGDTTYVGSFTALGDEGVRQQSLQTDDFRVFRMHAMKGDIANAKGMAIFPRRIGGKYAAICRQDNENLWLFTTDDPFTWAGGKKILEPKYPWEFVQIGNCGSPIEIDEGWLMLTHGVGVVRNYCMGAVLLDRDDPSKVLRRLPEPLIEPDAKDRDGYVPNVVYSCGGIVRDRTMLLPYGVADDYTVFCTVPIDDLLAAMEPQ